MERLREYLSEVGMTQAELATQVGVKQPTVWEWLNGKSKPSADRLLVLSEITGITVDELLKGAH